MKNKTQLKALLHTRFVPVNILTGKREAHSQEFMDFISDKVLPGLQEETLTVKDRIGYWQKIIKPQTTVN